MDVGTRVSDATRPQMRGLEMPYRCNKALQVAGEGSLVGYTEITVWIIWMVGLLEEIESFSRRARRCWLVGWNILYVIVLNKNTNFQRLELEILLFTTKLTTCAGWL